MDKWKDNDIFIINNLVEEDAAHKNVKEVSRAYNLPEAEVSITQGKFLYLLARIKNAKRILELGTLCGYSTIWLAKAVPDDGVVMTIEHMENNARLARENMALAGLSDKVKVICDNAEKVLRGLIAANEEPFDMIFIDADKPSFPLYLELSLQLSKQGTVIYGDNVVRDGELCNNDSTDGRVLGVRKFIENMGRLENLESTALQTVGVKGYDGFTLSVVK